MGYGSKSPWLSTVNVTFRWQATEISCHIPAVLRTLLLLVRSAQPAKVRLRASHSAQNDIQNFYFVIIVRTDDRWSPLPCNKKSPRILSSGGWLFGDYFFEKLGRFVGEITDT